MSIQEIYKLYSQNFLVDTDTRKIRQNTIFFALKGTNFNGNKFAEEALKKGAIYSIVDEKEYATNTNIILVDNVLKALQQLANYHRKQLNIPIIALTGSNGKTTTKELINKVLSKKYNTTATLGNLNNHIGVPLTLLSMTPKTEIGIVEMGANHHNEIAFLSKITEPDYGYITNFGKAHLEGFGSVEGVIEAKSELYDFLIANSKTVFVNPNDPIQVEKTKSAVRILFDESLDFIGANPLVNLTYKKSIIKSNLIGSYNYNNIASAITIGSYFDVDTEKIFDAISEYNPTNNRSQIIKTQNGNTIILDAYNANPTSMKAALDNFSILKASQKVVVLGDMFELGKTSLEEHKTIADLVKKGNFDRAFLVGENFKAAQNTSSYASFDEFLETFKQYSFTNAHFLIKGSRGMKLERLTEYIN